MAWARTTSRERSRFPVDGNADRREGVRSSNVALPDARALDALATLQSQLLSRVGHSLRSPLNAVIGFSDLMLAEIHGPIDPRYREYADHISSSGHELLRTAEDALAMAAVALGPRGAEREPLELRPIVLDACRLASPPVRGGPKWSERLVLALEGDLHIVGDRRAVRQALCNLVAIGLEIGGAAGSLAIAARPRGGDILLEIVAALAGPAAPANAAGAGSHDPDRPSIGAPGNVGPARLDLGLALAIAESLLDVQGGALEACHDDAGWSVRVSLPAPIEAVQLSLPID
jgi:signal transduction histidine kinase